MKDRSCPPFRQSIQQITHIIPAQAAPLIDWHFFTNLKVSFHISQQTIAGSAAQPLFFASVLSLEPLRARSIHLFSSKVLSYLI
jgi:hypothetical protein